MDSLQIPTLAIIQATPFCNIDCQYCYLTERKNKTQISIETLERIFNQVLASKIIENSIAFLWHAGEPLTVPIEFYEQAFKMSERINQIYRRDYHHSVQTNAILLNDRWIELFKRYNVRVGISLDSPEFIHNRNRITGSGKGTHAAVMKSVSLLQKAGMKFGTIMVLTRQALKYPDEIFNFFVENGFERLAFNIDEIEGAHTSNSYTSVKEINDYKEFMKRFMFLVENSKKQLKVREFRETLQCILGGGDTEQVNNTLNQPMKIISFSYKGDYTTFSPELLGTKSEKFSNFVMGNVHSDNIDLIFKNPIFQLVNSEIQAGVKKCKEGCEYWRFCGGGEPSNKFFEYGSFDVMKTLDCSIRKQALADAAIEYLESKYS